MVHTKFSSGRQLMLECLALLSWGGFSFGADHAVIVSWKAGNPYSDSFFYNGYPYHTIRISDIDESGFAISIGVAPMADHGCPGPGMHCTTNLTIVRNDGNIPFDVRADSIECLCASKKPKRLTRYTFPKYLRSAIPPGRLLLANTVNPGGSTSGGIIFSGQCNDYSLRIPIDVKGERMIFDFPVSPTAP